MGQSGSPVTHLLEPSHHTLSWNYFHLAWPERSCGVMTGMVSEASGSWLWMEGNGSTPQSSTSCSRQTCSGRGSWKRLTAWGPQELNSWHSHPPSPARGQEHHWHDIFQRTDTFSSFWKWELHSGFCSSFIFGFRKCKVKFETTYLQQLN